MKLSVILCLLATAAFCANINDQTYLNEFREALRHGAWAKVVFKVIDERNNPVSNAYINAGFWLNDQKDNAVKGYTDHNGLLIAEKKCNYDMNYWVEKNGYYVTQGQQVFSRSNVRCLQDGKWQPYGATNTVILKRKVNPVAMYVKPDRDGILPPVKNKFIGFDLEMGAWVQPYGPGANADILLKYEYEAGKIPLLHYRGAVFFSFTNQFDGAYVRKKDNFSAFMSVYQADTNATYQQNFAFVYDRLTGTIVENSKFSDSEYLVLRVRSKVDANGDLVAAHYAKIYGPIAAGGGGIYFGFYFNPNVNDPNLETDTTRNLLNPRDLGFPP